jgi:amino acid transporter
MNGAKSSIEIFRWFVHLATSATAIVWAVICVAFIRFYQGVKLRSDILSRRDESYPFRTPFQPYVAYFGAIMSSLIAVFLGVFLFLPGQWSTSQFFATYMSVFLFGLLYGVRKAITKSIIVPLDEIDFDTDRKAMENIGWAEDRVYHRGLIGSFKKYTSRMRQFIGTRWLAGFTK